MIRYKISEADLLVRIEHESVGWSARAATKTAACRAAKHFIGDGIWSEAKPAYMKLQFSKCCFCEQGRNSGNLGRVEVDVEHFRPKSSVKRWLTPDRIKELGLAPGEIKDTASSRGYYMLAHHPLNYAVSCKSCNSSLKSDYFPVFNSRRISVATPADADPEEPLLVYPIGESDEDPERIVKFLGFVAAPATRKADRKRYLRGVVTIKFFGLNAMDLRENLVRDRAQTIMDIMAHLDVIEAMPGTDSAERSKESVRRKLRPGSPHAGCARAFLRTYVKDKPKAVKFYVQAAKYLSSQNLGEIPSEFTNL